MQSISLFIFAYNEEKSLGIVAKEFHDFLSGLGRIFEIIIIDDGSSDGTGVIADRLSRENSHISVIHHERNYGLGSVYRTAFKNSRNDLVTFYFADGQFSAWTINKFLPLMEENDMALGYLPRRKDSLLSRFLSRVEKFLFYLLFGPIPRFQGVMMFRMRLLDKINLKSPGGRSWTVLMELIIRAQRNKYRITSIPIEMNPRLSGSSKINNLATITANLKQLIALRTYL